MLRNNNRRELSWRAEMGGSFRKVFHGGYDEKCEYETCGKKIELIQSSLLVETVEATK